MGMVEIPRTAAIFGATGLVGRACLDLLLAEERYSRAISIGRREPARTDAKLLVRRVALDNVEAPDDPMLGTVDDAFCCLGTSIAIFVSKVVVMLALPACRNSRLSWS